MEHIKVLNSGIDNSIDIVISNDIVFDNNYLLPEYTLAKVKENTNPVVDNEIEVLEPSNNYSVNLNLLVSGSTTQYFNNFISGGMFNKIDITSYSEKFLKSFYLLEFFDSEVDSVKKLVYSKRIYFRPKITTGVVDDVIKINFDTKLFVPIPKYKIVDLSNLYLRVRLFDAGNGILHFFKNNNGDFYNKITLDFINNQWKFYGNTYNNMYEYKNQSELNLIKGSNVNNKVKLNVDNNLDYIGTNGEYVKIVV